MRLSLGVLGGLSSLAKSIDEFVPTSKLAVNKKLIFSEKLIEESVFSRTEGKCDLYKEKLVRHVASWTRPR